MQHTRWFVTATMAISLLFAYGACGKKKGKATTDKTPTQEKVTKQKAPSRPGASTPAPRPKKQTTCEAFCSQMKKCTDDVAAYESKGKGPDALAKAKAALKKEFSDVAKCAAGCEKHSNASDKKNMAECLQQTACKAFVACLQKHD